MVSLPRTCQFCGKSLMHYGSCDCTNGRLDNIDAERKQIAERLKALDAEEKRLLKGTMIDLGVVAGSVPDRETAWLVERKVQPPQYCVEGYTDLPSLTDDPWRAARFATEREAFDYRLRLSSLRDECKETEHVFINKV